MKTIDFSPADEDALYKFHALPQQVYAKDRLWTPQSEAAVSSLFTSLDKVFIRPLLCVHGGNPLARAVAILHPGARDDLERPLGYIGFFECLEQFPQAGSIVLEHAEQILKLQGAASVQAPRVDNMLMGLVVGDNSIPQTVLTSHNPPYYLDILRSRGYRVREHLYTYIFDRSSAINFHIQLPGIYTRTFNRERLQEEVRIFHTLQVEIFKEHPGWISRTLDEDRRMIEDFLPMLDDELVIIAEDKDKRPLGLLVCLPDVYQAFRGQRIDNARLISIGAIPAMTEKGIGVVMCLHLFRNLLGKGYQTLEASWIRDSNILPQNLARRFNGRPGRTFALFEKGLSDSINT
ncbi:MAG: hypothetical protein A2030_07325 [Chloroflexi bacterium RBG_19FT_COMBO_50_10]|nr:MAG: hypothetical protein A2030_07325 [Chloroflexi bacterium RBG_19FT_COMBO_50_10]